MSFVRGVAVVCCLVTGAFAFDFPQLTGRVVDQAGVMYGITQGGGTGTGCNYGGCGTVYELSP